MSPTSYRAAPPRNLIVTRCGAEGQTRGRRSKKHCKMLMLSRLQAKACPIPGKVDAFAEDLSNYCDLKAASASAGSGRTRKSACASANAMRPSRAIT